MIKKIIILFLIAAAIAAGLIGYFLSEDSGFDIGFEFSKPPQVFVGEPFTLSVSLSNYSDKIINDAKLSIMLPDGMAFLGQDKSQRVKEESIGDIGPGSLNKQSFNLIVVQGSQSLKHINAKLSYRMSGSKAEFEANSGVDISIGQSSIDLSIEAPEKVFSGESFEIKFKYKNNSGKDIKNVHFKADYPPVFKFKKASIEPNKGNNYWDIGTLANGESGEIIISGSAIGTSGYHSEFGGEISADFFGENYRINFKNTDVEITESPLSISVYLNNNPQNIVKIGDELAYVLSYKNNSDTPMENVSIRASLLSELFDFTTVRTKAYFNSLTNTFLWNSSNIPELKIIQPGGQGNVEINIKLKKMFSIRRMNDKNFVLKVNAEIDSPTVPIGANASKTISMSSFETKVAGVLAVKSSAYFRDADSGILNSGPYPPKVNTPTQYTVHWTITNFANDVSDVVVSANLQSNTKFTGVVKSNIDTAPQFDASSGEIVWNIPNIPANKGVISEPIEAVFQLENIPSINDVNRSVIILGETHISGKDNFTGISLSGASKQLTTDLPDDPTIGNINRFVQQ